MTARAERAAAMPPRNADNDWLLTVAKVLLILAEIAFVFLLVAIVIGILGLLTFARQRVMADLAAAGAPDGAFVAMVGLLALTWLAISLCMLFVRHFRGVVDSVGHGDPFGPANAHRLTRMAWYALGVQACQFTIGAVLSAYGPYTGVIGGGAFAPGEDAPLTGLTLAITLFILARVFRKGAEMREDLDGTV